MQVSTLLTRYLLVVCLWCLHSTVSDAQDFHWAVGAGGSRADAGHGITIDAEGNIYVTGAFQGSITLGETQLSGSGSTDMFVAKFTRAGKLVWARKAGSFGFDEGRAIDVDADGNVYVTGFYNLEIAFGDFTLSPRGGVDIFVVKYDSEGTALWAVSAGGSQADRGHGIAADRNGNAYVTGEFAAVADFGDEMLDAGSNSKHDIFLLKINADGTFAWVRHGSGLEDNSGQAIDLDNAGNIYVSGRFRGEFGFDTQILNTASLEHQMFLVKFNAGGTAQWAQKGEGVTGKAGAALCVDGDGNSYLTGSVRGTAFFDNISVESPPDNGLLFIVRYSPSGTPAWVEQVLATDTVRTTGIALNDRGDVYICGTFLGALAFGPGLTLNAGSVFYDIFVARLDAARTFDWSFQASSIGDDAAHAVAAATGDEIAVTGEIAGNATFGEINVSGDAGNTDIFVASTAALPSGVDDLSPAANFTLFPNPAGTAVSVQVEEPLQRPYDIVITNLAGQTVFRKTFAIPRVRIATASFPAGLYLLEILDASRTRAKVLAVN